MAPCTKARLQTVFLRLATVAAVTLGVWFAAEPVGQYFQWPVTGTIALGAGAVAGVIALAISWRLFDFTQDCMSVPDNVATGAMGKKRKRCRHGACEFRIDDTVNNKAQPGELAPMSIVKPGCGTRKNQGESCKKVFDSEKISIELQRQEAGSPKIVVTIRGLSGSQFKGQNGLRSRLESISDITWSNPSNKDSVRVMEGEVLEANVDQALARVREVTARYS